MFLICISSHFYRLTTSGKISALVTVLRREFESILSYKIKDPNAALSAQQEKILNCVCDLLDSDGF
jgi:hypothetical protein